MELSNDNVIHIKNGHVENEEYNEHPKAIEEIEWWYESIYSINLSKYQKQSF